MRQAASPHIEVCVTSMGRRALQKDERDLEAIHDASGIVCHFGIAIDLHRKRAQQARAETMLGRRLDERASSLGPSQSEKLGRIVDPGLYVDVACLIGQSAIFDCICAQLIESHRKWQDRPSTNLNLSVLDCEP